MIKFSELIPAPKGYWGNGKYNAYEASICGDFEAEICSFAAYVKRLFDIELEKKECAAVTVKKCDCMTKGEYRIEIGEEDGRITVIASDSEGASYAFSTLLQLMEINEQKICLPSGVICDKAECAWRGLLIDCARRLHPLPLLKKYVDMCRFYKIKYLHLHLTDDEAYTLPSRAFPEITSKDSFYTYEEIEELDRYAYENGVSLIPELDTPGHSTAMLNAYPEVFGKEGIISFTEKAIEGTKTLYTELCELFPHSEYIHLGGDESRLGWWLDGNDSLDYGEMIGISVKDEAPGMTPNEYVMLRFLAHFIKEMADTVTACGKKPVVWEGFHKVTNGMIPKSVAVMVFDSSYQLSSSLIEDGFEVINCTWFPLYVVTPYWVYTAKDCYDWDINSFGTINEMSPYKHGTMRFNNADGILGGQLCSWGDGLKGDKNFKTPEEGLSDELGKIIERLPALAENTWSREKRRDYVSYLAAFEKTDAKLKKLLSE